MSTKEGGSLSLQMQCLWPSALQQPLEMTTPSSSFLEHADCTSVFPFQEKESERLEQGHMVLHLYFKVLKRLCFLFGFSGWVPVQNRLPRSSQHPTQCPTQVSCSPQFCEFLCPKLRGALRIEGPGCSWEVSMTNSGKARRVLLTSTKLLCHRIVASGAKIPPWHK